jgi:hypothetical protein
VHALIKDFHEKILAEERPIAKEAICGNKVAFHQAGPSLRWLPGASDEFQWPMVESLDNQAAGVLALFNFGTTLGGGGDGSNA